MLQKKLLVKATKEEEEENKWMDDVHTLYKYIIKMLHFVFLFAWSPVHSFLDFIYIKTIINTLPAGDQTFDTYNKTDYK